MQNKSGVTFIEVIIGITILGLLGSVTLPNLFKKNKRAQIQEFSQGFSTLIFRGLTHAIENNTIVQIYFDHDDNEFYLKEKDRESAEKDIHLQFKPIAKQKPLIMPDVINIKNFYIQKEDEMQAGKELKKIWFYVMPTGIVQPATINMEYEIGDNEKKLCFQITPFLGHTKIYETFKQP